MNITIYGSLDPREIIRNWKWTPHQTYQSWPVTQDGKGWWEVKYLHWSWLGVSIQLDNER